MGSSYSSATAGILLQLAQTATQDLTNLSSLVLPPRWSPTWSYTSLGVAGAPGSQGFYASGSLNGVPATVLALGVPWKQLYNLLYSVGLSPEIPIGNGYFEASLSLMYNKGLRNWIWTKLPSKGALYVTGIGAGGVLAQLASVDLRPGNPTPPHGTSPPSAAPVCYVFSTPLAGDRTFAAFYQSNVASSYSVTLGSNSVTVDLFPTVPTSAYGDSTISNNFYSQLGTAPPTAAGLPNPDDPWVERGANLYLSALGGTPTPPPTQSASIPNSPPGFDQILAYTLSQLCGVAYSVFQHPQLTLNIPLPYSLVSSLQSVFPLQPATNNPRVPPSTATVCSIFTSPSAVVVAFRGMVTWAEMLAVQGDSYQVTADFLPLVNYRQSSISEGAINVYTGTSGNVPFRTALVQALQQNNLVSGKSLYLTGHDFGGVLATIACYDLVSQGSSAPTPAALYTFGSQPAGDYVFAPGFNAAFKSSYQVIRPGDFISSVNPSWSYQQVNHAVSLLGVPPNDDVTAHSITSYIQLLNPSGFSSSSASALRASTEKNAAPDHFKPVNKPTRSPKKA